MQGVGGDTQQRVSGSLAQIYVHWSFFFFHALSPWMNQPIRHTRLPINFNFAINRCYYKAIMYHFINLIVVPDQKWKIGWWACIFVWRQTDEDQLKRSMYRAWQLRFMLCWRGFNNRRRGQQLDTYVTFPRFMRWEFALILSFSRFHLSGVLLAGLTQHPTIPGMLGAHKGHCEKKGVLHLCKSE
jgi:hypothetical protein